MSYPPITAVVVDDEPLARKRLIRLLREDPEINLVGVFGSGVEAAKKVPELAPQLMLLDIRMPETDGFQVFAAATAEGRAPYVIFVTAHADRPMDAFAVGAIDYLLKPFDDERFARAMRRGKQLIRAEPELSEAATAPRSYLTSPETRLLLTDRGKVVVLPTAEIEFIQAAAKYVKIYAGGRCLMVRHSLGQLEARLDPERFVRIHRSTLINMEHLSEMHPLFHGDYELVLKRGTRLAMSRRYRARLTPFLLR